MSAWTQDEIDDDAFRFEDDEEDCAFVCGRWDNGRLTRSCSMAGTEECDWDCPHSATLYKRGPKAMPLFSEAEAGAAPSELDRQFHPQAKPEQSPNQQEQQDPMREKE